MNEREAFERVTEGYYEGEFSKYADGEYVNPQQQDDFTMFKSGWQACEAQHKQKVRELILIIEKAREALRLRSPIGVKRPDVAEALNQIGKAKTYIRQHFGEETWAA